MKVRYQYIFVFCLSSILALHKSATADTLVSVILLANVAVASIGVGLAFLLRKPEMFMKTQNGWISFPGYLVFWPYFVLNHVIMGLYRLLSNEHPIDEIIPGLYLGSKLWSFEKEKLTQRDISAVVDVTAEWEEARYILKNCAYLWVSVLDTCSPTLNQLGEAVAWIEEQLKHGNVFVHCAVGHGRSTTIVAAYLLYAKKVTGVQGAIDFIKGKRPKINLHQEQLSILQEYTNRMLYI